MSNYVITIVNDTGCTDVVGVIPTDQVQKIERTAGYVTVYVKNGVVVTDYDIELDQDN